MSLTDLSPASVRAYENGARSFFTWAERGGLDGPSRSRGWSCAGTWRTSPPGAMPARA